MTDRVGNVLAVYRMTGAATTVTISSGRGINAGLDGVSGAVPDTLAAISKATSAASSQPRVRSARRTGRAGLRCGEAAPALKSEDLERGAGGRVSAIRS